MTQAQLAEQMSRRGFKWHAATVYKVENSERQIQLAEAVAIARILDTKIEKLTEHSKEVSNLRLVARMLRSDRGHVLRDLEMLSRDVAELDAELSKEALREHLSDGEYEELYREAHPDTNVVEAVKSVIRELNKSVIRELNRWADSAKGLTDASET